LQELAPLAVWQKTDCGFTLGVCLAEEARVPLIQVVMVLIVVGVVLWLINRFIPMQGTIKSILNGVVVIAVVLWLLNIFGVLNYFSHVRVGS
jgi:hypothetical protein